MLSGCDIPRVTSWFFVQLYVGSCTWNIVLLGEFTRSLGENDVQTSPWLSSERQHLRHGRGLAHLLHARWWIGRPMSACSNADVLPEERVNMPGVRNV